MALKTKEVKGSLVVKISGRMDVNQSSQIEADLDELIKANDSSDFILNLKDVEYMSSSGLRIFVSVMRQLKSKNRKLKLCELNYAVTKVFEIVELMDMFDIYEKEDEAIASL